MTPPARSPHLINPYEGVVPEDRPGRPAVTAARALAAGAIGLGAVALLAGTAAADEDTDDRGTSEQARDGAPDRSGRTGDRDGRGRDHGESGVSAQARTPADLQELWSERRSAAEEQDDGDTRARNRFGADRSRYTVAQRNTDDRSSDDADSDDRAGRGEPRGVRLQQYSPPSDERERDPDAFRFAGFGGDLDLPDDDGARSGREDRAPGRGSLVQPDGFDDGGGSARAALREPRGLAVERNFSFDGLGGDRGESGRESRDDRLDRVAERVNGENAAARSGPVRVAEDSEDRDGRTTRVQIGDPVPDDGEIEPGRRYSGWEVDVEQTRVDGSAGPADGPDDGEVRYSFRDAADDSDPVRFDGAVGAGREGNATQLEGYLRGEVGTPSSSDEDGVWAYARLDGSARNDPEQSERVPGGTVRFGTTNLELGAEAGLGVRAGHDPDSPLAFTGGARVRVENTGTTVDVTDPVEATRRSGQTTTSAGVNASLVGNPGGSVRPRVDAEWTTTTANGETGTESGASVTPGLELGGSDDELTGSVGYRISTRPDESGLRAGAQWRLDDDTTLRGSFGPDGPSLEFEHRWGGAPRRSEDPPANGRSLFPGYAADREDRADLTADGRYGFAEGFRLGGSSDDPPRGTATRTRSGDQAQTTERGDASGGRAESRTGRGSAADLGTRAVGLAYGASPVLREPAKDKGIPEWARAAGLDDVVAPASEEPRDEPEVVQWFMDNVYDVPAAGASPAFSIDHGTTLTPMNAGSLVSMPTFDVSNISFTSLPSLGGI